VLVLTQNSEWTFLKRLIEVSGAKRSGLPMYFRRNGNKMKTIGHALLGLWVSSVSHHRLARALTSDGRLVVVQLGDSYACGNGARDANGTVNFAGVPECYRSPTVWVPKALRRCLQPWAGPLSL
jgi:hypothetical protein